MGDTNDQNINKVLIVNGHRMTEQEFSTEKARVDGLQGAKLVEVSPGVWKTRLLD